MEMRMTISVPGFVFEESTPIEKKSNHFHVELENSSFQRPKERVPEIWCRQLRLRTVETRAVWMGTRFQKQSDCSRTRPPKDYPIEDWLVDGPSGLIDG
ncbi:hypothetical protein ColTof4_03473 [Colletotrichum tofieldiae]|nr:hypothetical protein ColTof4_03473 [Colletotrichum tofieldiae]